MGSRPLCFVEIGGKNEKGRGIFFLFLLILEKSNRFRLCLESEKKLMKKVNFFLFFPSYSHAISLCLKISHH